MKKRNSIIYLCAFILGLGLQAQENAQRIVSDSNQKIKVLNIGVFHMGQTSDANSTEYDETAKESKQQIAEVNALISEFKPTIILVEDEPKDQAELMENYELYLKDQSAKTTYDGNEIKLMGFEIGRLANVKRIYGIDHRMGYNYNQGGLAKELNAKKYFQTMMTLQQLESSVDMDVQSIGIKKVLSNLNTSLAYDFLINYNADALTYVNSENGFEGVDEAAKFYHRNLRMYANINKIDMNPNDRVLIISGATHAAFFQKFFSRSYVYELESVGKYLN
jgi:hypothetical protein